MILQWMNTGMKVRNLRCISLPEKPCFSKGRSFTLVQCSQTSNLALFIHSSSCIRSSKCEALNMRNIPLLERNWIQYKKTHLQHQMLYSFQRGNNIPELRMWHWKTLRYVINYQVSSVLGSMSPNSNRFIVHTIVDKCGSSNLVQNDTAS